MTDKAAPTLTAKSSSIAPPVRFGAASRLFGASTQRSDVDGGDQEAAVPDAAPLPVFRFAKIPIQAKLTVGPEGDAFETEADATAERVMRMPDPAAAPGDEAGQEDEDEKELRREKWEQVHPGDAGKVQRKGDAGAEKEGKKLQRKAEGGAVAEKAAPAIVHDVLRSPGQPLDAGTRAFMEPRFGRDFDGVRLHTDARAAASARAVSALAYTVGQDIVFGDGRYAPGEREGKRLLAHELSHVVQQGPAVPRAPGGAAPSPQPSRRVARKPSSDVDPVHEKMLDALVQAARGGDAKRAAVIDVFSGITDEQATRTVNRLNRYTDGFSQYFWRSVAVDLRTDVSKILADKVGAGGPALSAPAAPAKQPGNQGAAAPDASKGAPAASSPAPIPLGKPGVIVQRGAKGGPTLLWSSHFQRKQAQDPQGDPIVYAELPIGTRLTIRGYVHEDRIETARVVSYEVTLDAPIKGHSSGFVIQPEAVDKVPEASKAKDDKPEADKAQAAEEPRDPATLPFTKRVAAAVKLLNVAKTAAVKSPPDLERARKCLTWVHEFFVVLTKNERGLDQNYGPLFVPSLRAARDAPKELLALIDNERERNDGYKWNTLIGRVELARPTLEVLAGDRVASDAPELRAQQHVFEEKTKQIGVQMLDKFQGELEQEKKRYQEDANVESLLQAIGGTTAKQDYEEARLRKLLDQDPLALTRGMAPPPLYGTPAWQAWDKEHKARAQVTTRVLGGGPAGNRAELDAARARGDEQVGNVAGEHPLVMFPDFPRESLAYAEDTAHAKAIILRYIANHLENVKDAREKLEHKTDVIYKLDKLLAESYKQQHIEEGSLRDQAVKHRKGELASEELLTELTLNFFLVVFTVVTWGAGGLVVRGLQAGIALGYAHSAGERYTEDVAMRGAGLSSVDPEVAWVVVACLAAGIEAVGLLGKLVPAAKLFNQRLDAAEFFAQLEKEGLGGGDIQKALSGLTKENNASARAAIGRLYTRLGKDAKTLAQLMRNHGLVDLERMTDAEMQAAIKELTAMAPAGAAAGDTLKALETLGLAKGATKEAIRAKLMRERAKVHPDRFIKEPTSEAAKAAERRWRELDEAESVLQKNGALESPSSGLYGGPPEGAPPPPAAPDASSPPPGPAPQRVIVPPEPAAAPLAVRRPVSAPEGGAAPRAPAALPAAAPEAADAKTAQELIDTLADNKALGEQHAHKEGSAPVDSVMAEPAELTPAQRAAQIKEIEGIVGWVGEDQEFLISDLRPGKPRVEGGTVTPEAQVPLLKAQAALETELGIANRLYKAKVELNGAVIAGKPAGEVKALRRNVLAILAEYQQHLTMRKADYARYADNVKTGTEFFVRYRMIMGHGLTPREIADTRASAGELAMQELRVGFSGDDLAPLKAEARAFNLANEEAMRAGDPTDVSLTVNTAKRKTAEPAHAEAMAKLVDEWGKDPDLKKAVSGLDNAGVESAKFPPTNLWKMSAKRAFQNARIMKGELAAGLPAAQREQFLDSLARVLGTDKDGARAALDAYEKADYEGAMTAVDAKAASDKIAVSEQGTVTDRFNGLSMEETAKTTRQMGDALRAHRAEVGDPRQAPSQLGMTVHTGEQLKDMDPFELLKQVEESISLGADRIGHGLILRVDPEVLVRMGKLAPADTTRFVARQRAVRDHAIATGVTVEVNITSNTEISNLTSSEHPASDMVKDGLKVSVSTDDETVLNTTVRQELQRLAAAPGISRTDMAKVVLEGFHSRMGARVLADRARLKADYLRTLTGGLSPAETQALARALAERFHTSVTAEDPIATIKRVLDAVFGTGG